MLGNRVPDLLAKPVLLEHRACCCERVVLAIDLRLHVHKGQQGADRFFRGPLRRDGRALLALEREAETLGLGELNVPNRSRSVHGICDGLRQILCRTKPAKELVAGRALGCVRLFEAREEASASVVQIKVAVK